MSSFFAFQRGCDDDNPNEIGWSKFAASRHRKGTGLSYFNGTKKRLLDLVCANWNLRKPGLGRTDLDKVVLVPIERDEKNEPLPRHWFEGNFVSNVASTEGARRLIATRKARAGRKIGLEEPVIEVSADADPMPALSADVVLYHKDALLENNGTRSGDFEWEIVAVLANPFHSTPPMDPVTMARNYLREPGGTFAPYTAAQFAEAIWHSMKYVPISKEKK